MNHRETTPAPPLGAGQALPCLALLLLPLLAVANARARVHFPIGNSPSGQRGPYLPVLGAPALRFQTLTPPPLLAAVLPSTVTKTPSSTTDSSSSPGSPLHPSPSDSTVPTTPTPPELSAHADVIPFSPSPNDALANPPASAGPVQGPQPILHDDLRQPTRPEDFLPYFQLPGSGGVNGIAPGPASPPAPATSPPSSATYTQTPR